MLPHHTHDLHRVWGAEAKCSPQQQGLGLANVRLSLTLIDRLVTFTGGHNGSRSSVTLHWSVTLRGAFYRPLPRSKMVPGAGAETCGIFQWLRQLQPKECLDLPEPRALEPRGSSRPAGCSVQAADFLATRLVETLPECQKGMRLKSASVCFSPRPTAVSPGPIFKEAKDLQLSRAVT